MAARRVYEIVVEWDGENKDRELAELTVREANTLRRGLHTAKEDGVIVAFDVSLIDPFVSSFPKILEWFGATMLKDYFGPKEWSPGGGRGRD